MKIGELAHAAQCSVETVRYYEKEGLLPAPQRSAANYRHYGAAHLERLRFVRNCRTLDMTHDEIRTLLALLDQPAERCDAVNSLLDEHIRHVELRIAELDRLKLQLTQLRQQCHGEQLVAQCGIVHGLTDMETEAKPARHTHLG